MINFSTYLTHPSVLWQKNDRMAKVRNYRPCDCDSAHHSLNTAKRKYCRPQIDPSHQSPKRSDTLVRHRVPANESVMYFFLLRIVCCLLAMQQLPHFDYCSPLWDCLSGQSSDKLQKVHPFQSTHC